MPVSTVRVCLRGARAALVAAVLAVGAVVGLAAPSWADAERWLITRYDADIDVGVDGVADVRIEFDFDFGDEPGHGPFLTLPTRQAIEGDDERDRLYRITDISASSDTAPDDLLVDRGAFGVSVRIGDEDVDDVQGVHTYTVTYRVDGWINPAGSEFTVAEAGDELYVNVLGSDWEVPLEDVSATVTGPADIAQAACFAAGEEGAAACREQTSAVEGRTATLTLPRAEPGEPFTVVVTWPAGTFPGAEPIFGEKIDYTDPLVPTTATGVGALLVLVGGSALAVTRARRGGRDREAVGLPPGMVADGGVGGVGAGVVGGDGVGAAPRAFHDHRPPVAIQSAPPDGVLPGELGTLLDEVADPRDVTATIVDLAVRGYLRIVEEPAADDDRDGDGDGDGDGDPADWRLVAVDRDRGELLGFERTLLEEIFDGRDAVRMSELRTTFAGSMAKVQEGLYAHVTALGWFRANPRTVRRRWYAAGALLFIAAVVLGVVAFAALVDGLALVALALAVVGILTSALATSAPARTSAGTEVLGRAAAFKRYLETADADRLRLVHGEDLFSRYLPYAIAFGVTERWAGVFGDLAARGERVPDPAWYSRHDGARYGATHVGFWAAGVASGRGVEQFATVASESIAAATPGSSGASGARGGFAGGGVGGGGGGGW